METFQKVVKEGNFEPMRSQDSQASIDWDNDFCADPLQTGPNGEDYFIADPSREVPEDFDKIFIENDEQRLLELERISREIGIGGTIPSDVIDDLKVSSRPTTPTDGLGRRAGRQSSSVPETNVVDPWGKRRPRFGTRQKAANSKAILERMQQRDQVITEALADISYDLTGEGEPRARRSPPDFDPGRDGWVVRRADGRSRQDGMGRGDFQARKDPARPGYVQIRKFESGAQGPSPYSRFAQRQVLLSHMCFRFSCLACGHEPSG